MHTRTTTDNSIRILSVIFLLVAMVIIGRLFVLQILQHDYYATFALSAHEIYQKIHPRRGHIYFQDTRTGKELPAAVNREYSLVYAVPKDIPKNKVKEIEDQLIKILNIKETDRPALREKLMKADDPYEPISKKTDDAAVEKLRAASLTGIGFVAQEYRYYPENELASNELGFCGFDDNGNPVGSYGIEGYWDQTLAGKSGFLWGEKGALGSWIALAGIKSVQAQDGADLILTIDRALEYEACRRLKEGFEEYGAKSASLILMNPKTGAILAMCSYPDFNPNNYSEVKDIRAFNNTNVFTPYEPGSVFKPITMAAALDAGVVNPDTVFTDPCSRKIENFEIHNALNKCYGTVTMTQVLENSINTGAIWAVERLGRERFHDYVDKFGFGEKTGIALNTETAGDVSSLDTKGLIHSATASYGQGITATPLQLALAYSALANGGQLLKPFVVDEVRYADGRKEKTAPRVVDTVISPRASKLIAGMMVSVVDNGHGKPAQLPHYYLAGKTGTAQIAARGGYDDTRTNHTFAGFFPADDPQFTLVVKYEEPQRAWAESTAAPVFRDIAKFALQYYNVPEER